jgi:transposase
MDKKSKAISGLKKGKYFTTSERHQLIQEMMSLGCTKQEIWERYTGKTEEHGQVLRWMRELGYPAEDPARRPIFVGNNSLMERKKTAIAFSGDSFENLQLKKRIAELEVQLKDAEMKAIAFSTMVDIAEKQFNIPIRKKVNTKPLKK